MLLSDGSIRRFYINKDVISKFSFKGSSFIIGMPFQYLLKDFAKWYAREFNGALAPIHLFKKWLFCGQTHTELDMKVGIWHYITSVKGVNPVSKRFLNILNIGNLNDTANKLVPQINNVWKNIKLSKSVRRVEREDVICTLMRPERHVYMNKNEVHLGLPSHILPLPRLTYINKQALLVAPNERIVVHKKFFEIVKYDTPGDLRYGIYLANTGRDKIVESDLHWYAEHGIQFSGTGKDRITFLPCAIETGARVSRRVNELIESAKCLLTCAQDTETGETYSLNKTMVSEGHLKPQPETERLTSSHVLVNFLHPYILRKFPELSVDQLLWKYRDEIAVQSTQYIVNFKGERQLSLDDVYKVIKREDGYKNLDIVAAYLNSHVQIEGKPSYFGIKWLVIPRNRYYDASVLGRGQLSHRVNSWTAKVSQRVDGCRKYLR